MARLIILTYPDGHIAIRGNVAPSFLAEHGGDRDGALADIMANYVPHQNPDAIAKLVEVELPVDRYFRNAWEWRD